MKPCIDCQAKDAELVAAYEKLGARTDLAIGQTHRIGALERLLSDRELAIERLQQRIRQLDAIAAGAVVNAAERAVDVMVLQRGFTEGAGVDV